MHEIISAGYIYPNELHPHWSILIALYPYITGLVAGAFTVSSLYHVFGMKELKPVARLSLFCALGFALFATTPLLFHLSRPERALNIMFTPNLTSAMAGFGFIYNIYLVILCLEIWLIYRPQIIRYANQSKGIKKLFYWVLALGVINEPSERAKRIDKKVIIFLAAIGIPVACVLTGYVGFIFGSVVANPWWSTPLMPFIFILSAMISGIAMMIILYCIAMKIIGVPACLVCFKRMAAILWAFLIVGATLELMEIIHIAYEDAEAWEVISQLLSQKLFFSYYILQLFIGMLIPFILLGIVVIFNLKGKLMNWLTIISSVLLLVQVAAMRWNVVIGGQLLSKSLRGFTDYHLEIFGREGLLVAIIIFCLPFAAIAVFCKILPPFEKAEDAID
ncbi:polysulfide reductase NrfD [bacterium]|nr:polysulfide reductase NrfD [bacterium]